MKLPFPGLENILPEGNRTSRDTKNTIFFEWFICVGLLENTSHILCQLVPYTEPSSKDTEIQWGTICPRSRRCQLAQTGIPTSVLPSSGCPNYASASRSQRGRKEVPSEDLNLWIPQLSLMANRWINGRDWGIMQALWGEKEDSFVG